MVPYRIAETNQTFNPVASTRGWQNLTNKEAEGICWLFEQPQFNQTYVIACDPTMGEANWDRTIPQDTKADNAAIEVFRVGTREVKDEDGKTLIIPTDYQVAEYAAPVDYTVAAAVINALGRLYRGKGSMGVAHCIIEAYPGPGWLVERTLISKYGYLNLYHRKLADTLVPEQTRGIGWMATRQTVRDLWIHGVHHMTKKNVVIRSPWLLSEMKTTDPMKFQSYVSEASSGFHDDRLRAAMLAFWAAHGFSSQVKVETETTIERNKKAANWQASDLSADSLKDEWNKRLWEISES